MVRQLQEFSARAFPALEVERVGGWWLRYIDGPAWWAGSVLPHGSGSFRGALLGSLLGAAEQFYTARGAPARFQITPGAAPDGLDEALAARGYRLESPMSLQTTSIRCELSSAVVCEWPPEAWPAADRPMLERVTQPTAYASALGGASLGRAVYEDGWAGIFGMATRPDARGRGGAASVLAALSNWAFDLGATRLYLQVEPDNAAAVRLYARAGFTELCRYHYRVAASTLP
jgi:GNAT superfamily N-acetyltransferase